MTLDEATQTVLKEPMALIRALREVRDCAANIREQTDNKAAIDSDLHQFERDLSGKSSAEQLMLANTLTEKFSSRLLQFEREKIAAHEHVRQRDQSIREMERCRRDRDDYVAKSTRGLASLLATLGSRLAVLNSNLGAVAGPDDLLNWWDDLEVALESAKTSVGVELSRHGAAPKTETRRKAG